MGRIWSKGSTHPLQVGLQTDTVIKEISVVIPIEAGKRFTPRSSPTILVHIPKGLYILLQRHLFIHVHCCHLLVVINWKHPRCPSNNKNKMKMWYIYRMEYYSTVKKSKIIKFSDTLINE